MFVGRKALVQQPDRLWHNHSNRVGANSLGVCKPICQKKLLTARQCPSPRVSTRALIQRVNALSPVDSPKGYQLEIAHPQLRCEDASIWRRGSPTMFKKRRPPQVAFNCVHKPFFKHIVQRIAAAGPGFKLPSYDKLRGELLQRVCYTML
eukprot:366116-Chlamydomonas_euryale.AAC.13